VQVWLVSPAWRRYSVTRLALAQRRRLCDALALKGIEAHSVVVADDENLEIAREFDFDTVEMPNDDVGMKFNAGIRYAAEQGADVFVHVGSDDWVHPCAFDVLNELDLSLAPDPVWEPGQCIVWRRGPIVLAQRQATIVDLPTGRVLRCNVAGSRGVIPWFIPRICMDVNDWHPIAPGKMRGIDAALAKGLAIRPNWVFQEMPDDTLVDWKSGTNITPYIALATNIGRGEPVGLDALRERYDDDLVDMAVALHESTALAAA